MINDLLRAWKAKTKSGMGKGKIAVTIEMFLENDTNRQLCCSDSYQLSV